MRSPITLITAGLQKLFSLWMVQKSQHQTSMQLMDSTCSFILGLNKVDGEQASTRHRDTTFSCSREQLTIHDKRFLQFTVQNGGGGRYLKP